MDFDLATVARAVAHAVPDREFFVHGDTRMSFAQFMERAQRCARVLHDEGLGCRVEREGLASHESGQDHLALYLHNGHEFLEANIGAYAARVAPFNVNYRYVGEELLALLDDLRADGVVFHSAFAPTLQRVRDQLPRLRVLLQVDDGSGHPLLPGARWYEEALAEASPDPLPVTPSPDDLYILCTGGTTGRPKGVLWRQADIFVAALAGAKPSGEEYDSLADLVADADQRGGGRTIVIAPFMHGAGQWSSLVALTHGHTVVLPNDVTRLDPADVLDTCAREGIERMMVVGDAFLRPLLDEYEARPRDLSALRQLWNGGARLSAGARERARAAWPWVTFIDGLGSSETGTTATAVGGNDEPGVLTPSRAARVLSADGSRLLAPGDDELGWTANVGHIPLGYFADEAKTSATFPVVDGVRYVVPGDRVHYRADGRLEFQGRDSVTINSGGEKIFAEEVEQALLHHPAVADVVVCGRPSERWGSEVAAVVSLREHTSAAADDLLAEASKHLARYKLPKVLVFRDVIERSPSGKADYRWARAQVEPAP